MVPEWSGFKDYIAVILLVPLRVNLSHVLVEFLGRFFVICLLNGLVISTPLKANLKVGLLQDCLKSLAL